VEILAFLKYFHSFFFFSWIENNPILLLFKQSKNYHILLYTQKRTSTLTKYHYSFMDFQDHKMFALEQTVIVSPKKKKKKQLCCG